MQRRPRAVEAGFSAASCCGRKRSGAGVSLDVMKPRETHSARHLTPQWCIVNRQMERSSQVFTSRSKLQRRENIFRKQTCFVGFCLWIEISECIKNRVSAVLMNDGRCNVGKTYYRVSYYCSKLQPHLCYCKPVIDQLFPSQINIAVVTLK